MIDMMKLRAAVRALDLAEQRRAMVTEKAEAANKQAAAARAMRRSALEKAALGVDVNLPKFRRALDDAESTLVAYSGATDLAQKAVDEAEAEISAILRQHLRQREAEAQAAVDAAEADFAKAAKARSEAGEALAEAKRWAFDDRKLHSLFRKELSEARNEVPQKAA